MTRISGCLLVAALNFLLGVDGACAQNEPEWRYSVKRGDNPWNITERLLDGMKYWPQVQKHNRIVDPLNIAPGTELRIPIAWLRTEAGVAEVLAASREGCMLVQDVESVRPARVGDKLPAGAVLRAAKGGNCTLLFPDRSRVLLLEESELRIERIVTYAITGMHDIAARLLRGRVETNAARATGPASRFEISSPQGVTSVRGTRYRIASADTSSRAELLEGGLDVRNGYGQVKLDAGRGTVFTQSEPPAPPVPLLDAPVLAQLPRSAPASGAALPFPAVTGARAYRQQFAATADFQVPLTDRSIAEARLEIPALPEGAYHYRVRAIDALGLEGQDGVGALQIVHLLAAPEGCAPAASSPITTGSVNASCAPVSAARWYRVQLAGDDAFEAPLVDRLSGDPHAQLPLPRPGRYFWRMAAIDAAGREGQYTAAMPLQRALEIPGIELLVLDRDAMTLGWKSLPEARSYRLQLADDPAFSTLIEDQGTVGNRLVLARPAPGRYFARLAVVGGDGIEPQFGPAHALTLPAVGSLDWLPPLGLVFLFLL